MSRGCWYPLQRPYLGHIKGSIQAAPVTNGVVKTMTYGCAKSNQHSLISNIPYEYGFVTIL